MARVTSFYRSIPTTTSRVLVVPSATGTIKSYVSSTAALSVGESNITKAYLAVFGRCPDRSGLAYWVSTLGSSVSMTVAVNALVAFVASSYVLDTDTGVSISLLFHHLLGKVKEEDPDGWNYWVSVKSSGASYGSVAESMFIASDSASGYSADLMRNRVLAAESAVRLSKAYGRDLSVQTSSAAVLRVRGDVASYDAAMVDLRRLLVLGIASTPLSWGTSYSSGSIINGAVAIDRSQFRQFRNLVWYNRDGDMMIATVYLPPTFAIVAQHKAVIALHGGGWRQGYPEVIYRYCTSLASSFVVVAPTYRLSAAGYPSPAPENDVADFWGLLNSATFLKLYSGKIGIFGESSGGHLGCLLGAKQNVPRVLALYPPINLTGSTAVSAGLDPYVDYYTTNSSLQSAASPNLVWTAARTTNFKLWHGTSDTLVPSSQSGQMDSAVGALCTVVYRTGEGHGFSEAVRKEVVTDAISYFGSM